MLKFGSPPVAQFMATLEVLNISASENGLESLKRTPRQAFIIDGYSFERKSNGGKWNILLGPLHSKLKIRALWCDCRRSKKILNAAEKKVLYTISYCRRSVHRIQQRSCIKSTKNLLKVLTIVWLQRLRQTAHL